MGTIINGAIKRFTSCTQRPLYINSRGFFPYSTSFVYHNQHHNHNDSNSSNHSKKSKGDSNGNGPTCWQTRWRSRGRSRGGGRTGSWVLLERRKEYIKIMALDPLESGPVVHTSSYVPTKHASLTQQMSSKPGQLMTMSNPIACTIT